MIDLGSKPSEAKVSMSAEKDQTYYPSINIRDAEGLEDLPEGEFTFTGKGKLISFTESMRDGKKTCTCEIEIHGIKPSMKKEKRVKDAGERVSDAFDKIQKKKIAAYEGDEE